MRSSKVKRYSANLEKLKKLRSKEGEYDEKEEKVVLDLMSVIWEAMSIEDRDCFSVNNHISWPPPLNKNDE